MAAEKMEIAVIGGTGLMGPYLVSELKEAGHEVTCLNRRGVSALSSAMSCDRCDEEALRNVILHLDPDIVIDMIPYTRRDAELLKSILKAHPKVQLIAVSSIDVYLAYGRIHGTECGPYQPCPLREDAALRTKISFQGEHYDKLGVEEAYLQGIQNVSILRMPAIYGWPDRVRIEEYVKAAESGGLRLNSRFARWGYSRASAQDCAHAIFLTIGLKGKHLFNVGEEDLLTEENWCKEVWRAMGVFSEIIYDDDHPIPFNADIKQKWHVDTTKIRLELGYKEKRERIEVLRHAIEQLRGMTRESK